MKKKTTSYTDIKYTLIYFLLVKFLQNFSSFHSATQLSIEKSEFERYSVWF